MSCKCKKIELIYVILILCMSIVSIIIFLSDASKFDKIILGILSLVVCDFIFRGECINNIISGKQYSIMIDIEKIKKINGLYGTQKIIYEIEKYYENSECDLDTYISRVYRLEKQYYMLENVKYGIFAGLLTFAGTTLVNYNVIKENIKNIKAIMLISSISVISILSVAIILDKLFFFPTKKNERDRFILNKELKILDGKIEDLLKNKDINLK